ncbi:hypothetical protein [Actinomyces urogenitalis]|nr:hypothetical protein [Actinomyces urogenitalis]
MDTNAPMFDPPIYLPPSQWWGGLSVQVIHCPAGSYVHFKPDDATAAYPLDHALAVAEQVYAYLAYLTEEQDPDAVDRMEKAIKDAHETRARLWRLRHSSVAGLTEDA